jgi:hypothetical protein
VFRGLVRGRVQALEQGQALEQVQVQVQVQAWATV